jgi:transcriptional regulator with XRE-family HTH domain
MTDLGEFLRSRRALLQPEDAGLPQYGGRRRVPGLRREELAQLAGVSAGYYTRLEQGLSPNASDAVLDAVARVLRLDEDERSHLYALARPVPVPVPCHGEQVRGGVQQMIDALGAPAVVMGRFLDVLAWNASGHALLAGHLDAGHLNAGRLNKAARPNIARLTFLDPHTRNLYANWPQKARATVADLRMIAGRYPDDPELSRLIGDLTLGSLEFSGLWSAHSVGDCGGATRVYQHPVAGRMELTIEMLTLEDDGQRVAIFTAEPGSASEAALRLLSVEQ